jgi:hypothetical protein
MELVMTLSDPEDRQQSEARWINLLVFLRVMGSEGVYLNRIAKMDSRIVRNVDGSELCGKLWLVCVAWFGL